MRLIYPGLSYCAYLLGPVSAVVDVENGKTWNDGCAWVECGVNKLNVEKSAGVSEKIIACPNRPITFISTWTAEEC
jgi:hypothetical protein